MKPNRNLIRLAPTLMLTAVLASGCAHRSQPLPPVVVEPPAIPALPAQARQPTPPPICLPTCSAGLTRLRTELLNSLTAHTQPETPASKGTAR